MQIREKQIEEIARVWCSDNPPSDCAMCGCRKFCYEISKSEMIYDAGYRKQSEGEWISVEERLPQVTGKYICCVKDNGGNTWSVPADWSLEMKMWFGEFGEIKNTVTHWMPLPEPPKMKGGAG